MSTKRARTSGIRLVAGLLLTCLAATLPAASTAQGVSPWRAQYFDNPNLIGQAVLERNESSINYDWQDNPPSDNVPADHFSVRWTAYLPFDEGQYAFKTYADGGVRLWIDGQLLIGEWGNQALTEFQRHIDVAAGYHSLRLEYCHHTGNAVAKLWWERQSEPLPPNRLRVEYFPRLGGPNESWYARSVHYKGKVYPAPTVTSAPPARTPSPTSTPTGVPLGHWSNPVPLGEPVTFMNLGSVCTIALEETMHGQPAYELRNQGADSTSVPKEGCEYYRHVLD